MLAGKKLHEILVESGNDGVDGVVRKYLQECQLMSTLHHPNITLFLNWPLLPPWDSAPSTSHGATGHKP